MYSSSVVVFMLLLEGANAVHTLVDDVDGSKPAIVTAALGTNDELNSKRKQKLADLAMQWAAEIAQEDDIYGTSLVQPTTEVYGKPKDGGKEGEIEWNEDRKKYHDQLVDEALKDMMELAEAMKDGTPGIYCLRGNTAAGKTMAITSGMIDQLAVLKDESWEKKKFATLNPDAFKQPLIQKGKADGKTFTHADVHAESSFVAGKVLGKILAAKVQQGGKEVSASIVVDKRLANNKPIANDYIPQAKASGRKLFIYDIDCPLKFSLQGVLKRTHDGDAPIPPFDAIAKDGYIGIVQNRQALIDMFTKGGAWMGDYFLFKTKSDFSKELVMTVSEGKEEVKDEAAYKEVMAQASKAEEVVKTIKDEVIDDKVVDGHCKQLSTKDYQDKCTQTLCGWKDKTWKVAVDGYSKGDMSPDRSKCSA